MVHSVQTKFKQIIAAEIAAPSDAPKLDARWLWACAAILAAIVFIAYGRTLTTFFLADDFGEVAYVSRIVDSGRWDLFWSNWTGNFMQIPGMAVYRPLLLVSLLTDYALWKANALGFYLTNMLFYVGDTIVFFLLTVQLTKQWGQTRALMTAFAAAALFAVNPLHCETVSWVVGRVDSSCLLFSLSSVLCFVIARERQAKTWMAASVFCFIAGILFKEMAIGVPLLITAIAVIFYKGDAKASPLQASHLQLSPLQASPLLNGAISVGKLIAPIWIATAIYFVVRYIVLGTLTGGYTGAIGDGQGSSAFQRWLDPFTYERVILPFAASLFPANSGLANITKLLYASSFTLIALRVIRGDLPWRYVALIGAWMISAAVPIYKLWGIGMDLEGARFCFFLTVPLCLLLPALLFAPSNKVKADSDKATLLFSAAVLAALTLVSYKVALHSNANWVHAGKEVRGVLASASELATQHEGKQLAVLGIPKVRAGAHMIYNGATFRTLLDPPFTRKALSSLFLTFDPIFYGPDQYINAARFKSAVSAPTVGGAYVWNSDRKAFDKLQLRPAAVSQTSLDMPVAALTSITNPKAGDGIVLPVSSAINPWLYDYLEVRCHITDAKMPLKFSAAWEGTNSTSDKNTAERTVSTSDGGNVTVRIPVSHYWRWFAAGDITKLVLYTPGVKSLQLQSVKLMPSTAIRPTLTVRAKSDDGSGVYAVEPSVPFLADARTVPGAQSILIECSKANYFFDQIEEKDQQSAVHKSTTSAGTTYDAKLPADFLPKQQYCELRVRALDAQGKPIGEYSEPVIVYAK
jgi:hypothetical protein